MTRTAAHRLVVLLLAALPVPASAEAVTVRELFHAQPEEWCGADEGIPVTVEMTGLPVHAYRQDEERGSHVRVRRGGERMRTVEVRPVAPDRIRQWFGSQERVIVIPPLQSSGTSSFAYGPSGMFNARGNVCLGLNSKRTGQILWSVVDEEGTTVMRGKGTSWDWWHLAKPIRHAGFPTSFSVGDDRFFVLEQPNLRKEIVVFPEPGPAAP